MRGGIARLAFGATVGIFAFLTMGSIARSEAVPPDVPVEEGTTTSTSTSTTTSSTTTTSVPASAPAAIEDPRVTAAGLTVTPNTLLLDHQIIAVDGSGFLPSTTVALLECTGDTVAGTVVKCVFSTLQFVNTDLTGAFSTTMEVRRVISSPPNPSVDCANVVDPCMITATELPTPTTFAATADLGFDASVPLPPPPVLTVDPSGPLRDGQVVTLQGSGYSPFAPIGIAQCKQGATFVDDCDGTNLVSAIADVNGAFVQTFRVKLELPTGHGVVDCSAAPGICTIGAANTTNYLDEADSVSLTFDPPVKVAGLAATGASIGTLTRIGVAVLLAGLALVALPRRSRQGERLRLTVE